MSHWLQIKLLFWRNGSIRQCQNLSWRNIIFRIAMDIFLCFDASQSVWAVPYGWWYLTWPKQDFMYPPTWLSKAQVKGRDSPMKFLTWEGKLSLFHDRSAFVRAENVPKKGTQMLGRYSHLLSFATLFLLSSSFLHKFHPSVYCSISPWCQRDDEWCIGRRRRWLFAIVSREGVEGGEGESRWE